MSHFILSVASTALSADIEKLLKLILAASRVNCFELLENHESRLTFGVLYLEVQNDLAGRFLQTQFIKYGFHEGDDCRKVLKRIILNSTIDNN